MGCGSSQNAQPPPPISPPPPQTPTPDAADVKPPASAVSWHEDYTEAPDMTEQQTTAEVARTVTPMPQVSSTPAPHRQHRKTQLRATSRLPVRVSQHNRQFIEFEDRSTTFNDDFKHVTSQQKQVRSETRYSSSSGIFDSSKYEHIRESVEKVKRRHL